jgi:hypothetical protein
MNAFRPLNVLIGYKIGVSTVIEPQWRIRALQSEQQHCTDASRTPVVSNVIALRHPTMR